MKSNSKNHNLIYFILFFIFFCISFVFLFLVLFICYLVLSLCILCFTASYNTMPVATDTFKDSNSPGIGILIVESQIFSNAGNTPLSSLPITIQQGTVQSVSKTIFLAVISVAKTDMPFKCIVSTAFIKLFTRHI
jgi:hypothetical protein